MLRLYAQHAFTFYIKRIFTNTIYNDIVIRPTGLFNGIKSLLLQWIPTEIPGYKQTQNVLYHPSLHPSIWYPRLSSNKPIRPIHPPDTDRGTLKPGPIFHCVSLKMQSASIFTQTADDFRSSLRVTTVSAVLNNNIYI